MRVLLLLGFLLASPESDNKPVPNLIEVTPQVFSGAQPDAASFEALAALGIKTIISVDGARPDVEAAHAHGMRYVHIPIGYDGIAPEEAAAFRKTLDTAPDPYFVHCHHGKHRGPAMAALALRLEYPQGPEKAEAYLRRAGTSTEYGGLWACVRNFDPAQLEGLDPELHETAPISSLAAEMVAIDRHFDALVQFQRAAWAPLAEAPDLNPAHEALQLHERLRELVRLEPDRPEGYSALLTESAARAGALADALRTGAPADALLEAVRQDCRRCHTDFRN